MDIPSMIPQTSLGTILKLIQTYKSIHWPPCAYRRPHLPSE